MPRHLKEWLPPQVPCMHAMSPIQRKQAPTNQSMTRDFTWIHGPTRVPKPPQEHVYTGDRLKDPQDSHPKEAHPEWGPPGIARPQDRPNRPCVG
jgi:hypothetical protein